MHPKNITCVDSVLLLVSTLFILFFASRNYKEGRTLFTDE